MHFNADDTVLYASASSVTPWLYPTSSGGRQKYLKFPALKNSVETTKAEQFL